MHSVTEGATSIAPVIGSVAQNYQVRFKATDTAFASATLSVSVPARGAAPNVSYYGPADAIRYVSTAMEYSLDNGDTWTSCTTTTIPRSIFGNTATTVKVRVKATATTPCSNVKDDEVPDALTMTPASFNPDKPALIKPDINDSTDNSLDNDVSTPTETPQIDIDETITESLVTNSAQTVTEETVTETSNADSEQIRTEEAITNEDPMMGGDSAQ